MSGSAQERGTYGSFSDSTPRKGEGPEGVRCSDIDDITYELMPSNRRLDVGGRLLVVMVRSRVNSKGAFFGTSAANCYKLVTRETETRVRIKQTDKVGIRRSSGKVPR